MVNIKIKNSNYINLLSFLKENKITYKSKKNEDGTETIHFFTRTQALKNSLLSILTNYVSSIYHDTVLSSNFSAKPKFNYVSRQYENIITDNTEEELPMFYIENLNDQNERLASLKALRPNVVSESYIKSIGNAQKTLNQKSPTDLQRIKNIYFGNDFDKNRSKKFVDGFPYYNKLQISSHNSINFLGDLLNKLDFREEMIEDFISPKGVLTTDFLVNNSEMSLQTYSLEQTLLESTAFINETNKVILSREQKKGRFAGNNFKKHLVINHLKNNSHKFSKSFKQIYENEMCKNEFILYKVEKFRREETVPIQNFWLTHHELNDFYDYQIKLNTSYSYTLKGYSIIYGCQTSVRDAMDAGNNVVKANFSYSPSYRMAIVNLEEISIKTVPNPQMPPAVAFLNESNSENSIKIYLDLKNSSMSADFVTITSDDVDLIENVELNPDGKVNFEYLLEDGNFEVFRLSSKPESYVDFENAKILDVKNRHSSTSVVFKDFVLPNKKYYYIFRAVNLGGIPSNPTKVYEVELIKDASKSTIHFKTIEFKEKEFKKDKSFKSLLQITPANDQEVFDDETEFVNNLPSFTNKVNNLTLGVLEDKLWGKKFKIRVKSKDTGKIIDLNVKFNLIKDNIK